MRNNEPARNFGVSSAQNTADGGKKKTGLLYVRGQNRYQQPGDLVNFFPMISSAKKNINKDGQSLQDHWRIGEIPLVFQFS